VSVLQVLTLRSVLERVIMISNYRPLAHPQGGKRRSSSAFCHYNYCCTV